MFQRKLILLLCVVIVVAVLSCAAGAGSEDPSPDPEPNPETPDAPSELAADAITGATIKLTWTDNADNEEGFTLQRAENAAFTGATEIAIAAEEESYLDTALATGHTYYYRIRSFYGSLISAWSNTADEELPEVITPPAAPENITATAQSATSVLVTWSDKSDNETGFLLQRAENAAFTGAVSLPQSADAEAYTDNGCAADTNYWYRIRSENSAGSSSYVQTGPVKTPEAGSDTVIKVHFTDGVEHGGQKIYTIWLANENQSFYRNIFVCNRIKLQNLQGTGLPNWEENIRPHFTSSEIDAVSGPTVATGNFTREITLNQNDPRQFTVYFEVDHSRDGNDWFGDQPAVLFAADVDLDDSRTSYSMSFIGWTPNENTDGGTPGGVYGVLNTVLKYILEKIDGTEEPEPATDLVGDLTVTIER